MNKSIEGIWYNPKTNEIIDIVPVYSIWFNCCIMDAEDSEYYQVSLDLLKASGWIRIGEL